ncbi:MAG: hypothetical protein ACRD5W_12905 [Candidatus Acidiferrales bacterium]
MMLLVATVQRLGHPALGWIVPGAIFVVSFVLTWMVYKHFSRKSPE